jgi:hypothetical protein
MQIKTALIFYLTPVRMAIIKNTNNKCWQRYGVNNIEIYHNCVGAKYNKIHWKLLNNKGQRKSKRKSIREG